MLEQSPDPLAATTSARCWRHYRRLPGETRQNPAGSDHREFNKGEHHESAPR
jgi:hypothetical protein